eukprot:Amastigsp_a850344_8.p3 type:complete len:129 gc:universal Amastigsp_a850344_8:1033-647(-)
MTAPKQPSRPRWRRRRRRRSEQSDRWAPRAWASQRSNALSGKGSASAAQSRQQAAAGCKEATRQGQRASGPSRRSRAEPRPRHRSSSRAPWPPRVEAASALTEDARFATPIWFCAQGQASEAQDRARR